MSAQSASGLSAKVLLRVTGLKLKTFTLIKAFNFSLSKKNVPVISSALCSVKTKPAKSLIYHQKRFFKLTLKVPSRNDTM